MNEWTSVPNKIYIFWLYYFTFMLFLLPGNAAISSNKAKNDEKSKLIRKASLKELGQFLEIKEGSNTVKTEKSSLIRRLISCEMRK